MGVSDGRVVKPRRQERVLGGGGLHSATISANFSKRRGMEQGVQMYVYPQGQGGRKGSPRSYKKNMSTKNPTSLKSRLHT